MALVYDFEMLPNHSWTASEDEPVPEPRCELDQDPMLIPDLICRPWVSLALYFLFSAHNLRQGKPIIF